MNEVETFIAAIAMSKGMVLDLDNNEWILCKPEKFSAKELSKREKMTNAISIKLSDLRTRNRMDACYYVALNLHKERVKILLEKDIDDLRKIATLIGNNKKALQAVGKGTFAKFNPETYNKEEVALYIAIAEQEVLTELSENIAKYQNIKNELESLLARK